METPMGRLKGVGIFFSFIMAVLFSGCAGHEDAIKDATLPPIAGADLVIVQNSLSGPIGGVNDITNEEQISKITAFVSALPPQWTVPWYGSPIGELYFYFYKDGACVGIFYVGTDFFGRNTKYGPKRLLNFFSQPASKAQIQELSQITGFDVWKYSRDPEANWGF